MGGGGELDPVALDADGADDGAPADGGGGGGEGELGVVAADGEFERDLGVG